RIVDWVRFALYELNFLSPLQLVLTFWPCFLIDAPWYTLTDVIVFIRSLLPRKVFLAFEARLESSPPLVTVLVPAHNEAETVGHTIRSLLDSDYRNIEVICIDDGSEDDSYRIARRIASRDPRLRVLRQYPRGGKSSALNRALLLSRGEFVVV